jgi:hypothetical protein
MNRAANWIALTFSEAPGEPSVRRQAFGLAVLNCVLLCWAGLFVEISMPVQIIALALLTGTTTGVTAGRFAEKE